MSEEGEFEKRKVQVHPMSSTMLVKMNVIKECKKELLEGSWFTADKSSICISYEKWKKWFGNGR